MGNVLLLPDKQWVDTMQQLFLRDETALLVVGNCADMKTQVPTEEKK